MSRFEMSSADSRRQDGFTLIELIIALAVTVIVMIGILFLFDINNKLARAQTNIADMQQSLRVAQYDMVRMLRMAGRGGLPPVQAGLALPTGAALSLVPNVPDDTHIVPGDTDTPKILEGTDVLVVRGVFSMPVYQIDYVKSGSYRPVDPVDPSDPLPQRTVGGAIEVCSQSHTGVNQDLEPLRAVIREAQTDATKSRNEALILVSPLDDSVYGVVQLDPGTSSETAVGCVSGSGVTLVFKSDPGADLRTNKYRALSSAGAGENLPSGLTKVAFVGILEEYRFYAREEWATGTENADRGGTPTNELLPTLARARFYPGTQEAYGGDEDNLRVDIADGILDLQVALGIDANSDGRIQENPVAPNADEWMGNDPDDAVLAGRLAYARLSTVARTNRRDKDYRAPDLPLVEDHEYDIADPMDRANGDAARLFRRRILQTVVDLRNL